MREIAENFGISFEDMEDAVNRVGNSLSASKKKAEEATPPTLGGAPENVEQKIDSGEAKLAKDEDLDPDMFKDETQKKMEVNEDAVAGPKGKERDWNGGGYVSTSPSVGPSAMPGQEL